MFGNYASQMMCVMLSYIVNDTTYDRGLYYAEIVRCFYEV